MNSSTLKGILKTRDNRPFILDEGREYFNKRLIWEGYPRFWEGMTVRARELTQKDYGRGEPIILISPDGRIPEEPYVELYYNERLKGKPISILGHLAINVNGRVFNYSYFINETEEISTDEYFYRPPLGEFSRDPLTGEKNFSDPEKPYYHKPGRLFLRGINVLHIRGLDTGLLESLCRETLYSILAYPRDPRQDYRYMNFKYVANTCATFTRDILVRAGMGPLRGFGPRDIFVRAAYNVLRGKTSLPLKGSLYRLDQLKIPEEDYSAPTPLLLPLNTMRDKHLLQFPFPVKKYWGDGEWLTDLL